MRTRVRLIAAIAAALVTAWATCAAQEAFSALHSDMSADPETATRVFNEANALYARGSHDEACALYEQIVTGGFENADVYYNLGNACYKTGRIGQAVLAYERALRLEPGHEDAAANLSFVRGRLADRQTTAAESAVAAAVERFYRRVPSTTLAVIASASFFALALALLVAILRGGFAAWNARVAWVLGAVLLLAGGAAAVKVAGARSSAEAVVLAREVAVRTGPGDDFVIEFKLHEGTKVRLREARGDWARASVSGTDLEGWLPFAAVEAIERPRS